MPMVDLLAPERAVAQSERQCYSRIVTSKSCIGSIDSTPQVVQKPT